MPEIVVDYEAHLDLVFYSLVQGYFPFTTKSLLLLANPGPLENLIRRQF